MLKLTRTNLKNVEFQFIPENHFNSTTKILFNKTVKYTQKHIVNKTKYHQNLVTKW